MSLTVDANPGADPDEPGLDPEELGKSSRDLDAAPQWKLVWWRFRRHRLAVVATVVLFFMYLVALLAGFVAPHNTSTFSAEHSYQPPQRVHVSAEHGLYVHPTTATTDLETLKKTFTELTDEYVELGFFVKGDPYTLLGFIKGDTHLFGPKDPTERVYLLGADRMGSDLLSKIIYGSQVSLSIGLIGVAVSLVLGMLIGGISGYFGGTTDTIVQRLIELIMSIPTLPLWLGLAAAVPPNWGPERTYLMITVILSLIGWTSLARVVRGRLLQVRTEDYVMAARLDGVSTGRIINKHLLPSLTSHIIATVSLAIPSMILAETSLSFLGLGMRPPSVSWGMLLQDAQSVQVVANAPWLLLPGLAVVLAVIAFNFVGDGLRDSADPYGTRH